MKKPEEIKSLAETAFQEELIKSNQNINWIGYGKGIDGISKEKWIELWIKGYTQCQQGNDNKYTIKEVERYHDVRVMSGVFEANRYLQSLNTKTPLSWWNDLSEQEQIQIQKDSGIYGHDEGVTVSEIETFYNDYLQSINK